MPQKHILSASFYYRYWILFFSSVVLALFSLNVWAVERHQKFGLALEHIASGEDISHQVFYLKDSEGHYDVDQVIHMPWELATENGLNFGYTKATYWFRIGFHSELLNDAQRLLVIAYPVLDNIRVYQRDAQGVSLVAVLGDKQPFSDRLISHRDFTIPFEVAPNAPIEYFFQVNTSSALQFPLSVWTERDFFLNDIDAMLVIGIYYGIMLVMFFYNLFLYLSTRDISYLYYVAFVASMALFLASFQGLAFQYLWPEAIYWNDRSIVLFLGTTVLFAILFTRRFLYINRTKWINLLLGILFAVVLCILFFNRFFSYYLMIQVTIVGSFFYLILAFVAGVVRWAQGYSTARYYTIAWLVMMLGGVILALNKFNIIPRNFFTEYILQIGSAIEVTLLSLALADRLNQEKRKRYQAQDQALLNERIARKAQYDAFQAQIEANESLEQRVKERTQALEQANQQLQLMSITDPLTNVHNRRFFDQTMQSEMLRSMRNQQPLSLLIIDIDHFKQVNDTYGHQAGDEVLKVVAQAIEGLIHRSGDVLARYGGEEFVLILPNTPIEGAIQLAQKITMAVPKIRFEAIDEQLVIQVSIGLFGAVATAQSHYEQWIRNADDALYKAKAGGRNQLVVYQPD